MLVSQITTSGVQRGREADDVRPVVRFGDDLDVIHRFQHGADAVAKEWVGIGHQDADHDECAPAARTAGAPV
jgi:hypothetical protein